MPPSDGTPDPAAALPASVRMALFDWAVRVIARCKQEAALAARPAAAMTSEAPTATAEIPPAPPTRAA